MRPPFPLLPASLRWLAVFAVAAILVYFSLLTNAPASPRDPGPFWDKKLHFAGYLAMGLTLAYATSTSWRPRRTCIGFVLGGAIAFGIAIELLQGPLPDRYFSYADMLANAIGALLASAWFVVESRFDYRPIPFRS